MFELESAISEWRSRMIADGIKTPVPLYELETHLRDSVEAQLRSGVEPQSAFEIAVREMGQPQAVAAEFAWIGKNRILPLAALFGIACFTLSCVFSLWVAMVLLRAPEPGLIARLLAFIAVGTIVCSWRYGHRLLPVIPRHSIRTIVGLVCCAACLGWQTYFMQSVLPHFIEVPAGMDLPVGPMLVSLLWAWTLTAVVAGIAPGLEFSAHRQQSTARLPKDNS